MNALEHAARQAWRDWLVYAKWTHCSECGEVRYCGAARGRRRWLCFECWDMTA
jgi:hypothetical protein